MGYARLSRGRNFPGIFRVHVGIHRRRLALFGVLLLTGAVVPRLARAEVGAVAGDFSVTPNGGAQYTIPIVSPGGINGLAPSLALVYGSDLGEGLAGWGATISGDSQITRCPSTYAYDGSTEPVNLTTSDRFCLDGQELSATSGTYGGYGTLYETTPTAHLEAISHDSNIGIGPDWFQVLHPDGTVWEYGNNYNSEVTAPNTSGTPVGIVWYLDKITDPYGNSIQFHYSPDQADHVAYLSEVDWGAGHSLNFTYTDMPADAVVQRYVGGDLVAWTQRLTTISYEYNGSNVLVYNLGYLPDGQGSDRSRIDSVNECDDGGDCVPATALNWQQGNAGYNSPTDTGQVGPADSNVFTADINGDGREDFFYDRGGLFARTLRRDGWRLRYGAFHRRHRSRSRRRSADPLFARSCGRGSG
ncbi:MAG: SpvB/TcaC N-terminal domain-containing protein [Gammaproteobacteria bacterium]